MPLTYTAVVSSSLRLASFSHWNDQSPSLVCSFNYLLKNILYLWNRESPDSNNPYNDLSSFQYVSCGTLNWSAGSTYKSRCKSCICRYAFVTFCNHMLWSGNHVAIENIILMFLCHSVLHVYAMRRTINPALYLSC